MWICQSTFAVIIDLIINQINNINIYVCISIYSASNIFQEVGTWFTHGLGAPSHYRDFWFIPFLSSSLESAVCYAFTIASSSRVFLLLINYSLIKARSWGRSCESATICSDSLKSLWTLFAFGGKLADRSSTGWEADERRDNLTAATINPGKFRGL